MEPHSNAVWQARAHVASRLLPLSSEDDTALARMSAKHTNGTLSSRKNGCCVPWRSRDERDLMRLLELDHAVVSYKAMPEKLEIVVDGKTHRHLPALRVSFPTAVAVLDVSGTAPTPGRARFAELLAEAYEAHGIRYACIRVSDIHMQPRFGNALHALSRRPSRVLPDEALRVVEALTRRGGTAIHADLQAQLGQGADVAFAMASTRQVKLDLSVSDPSRIRISLAGGMA